MALIFFFNKGLFIDIFGSSFFYRMDRITGLFTSSYQLDMALINMGSGGLLGLNDIYSIPEATTDFAFSLMVSLIKLYSPKSRGLDDSDPGFFIFFPSLIFDAPRKIS